MSLLRYVKVVSRTCEASILSEAGESSTGGQEHNFSDDVDPTEEPGPSAPKRIKTVNDCKMSASEIDAILTAEVPGFGMFYNRQSAYFCCYP